MMGDSAKVSLLSVGQGGEGRLGTLLPASHVKVQGP